MQYKLLGSYFWDFKIGKLSKEIKILMYCRNAGYSYQNSEKQRSIISSPQIKDAF